MAKSATCLLAAIAGVMASAFWVSRLPQVLALDVPPVLLSSGSAEPHSGSARADLDCALRWGESALAAAAVAATVWGPSIGALILAPVDAALLVASGISFALTCLAVAAVSFMRRFTAAPGRLFLAATGGVSLGCIAFAWTIQ